MSQKKSISVSTRPPTEYKLSNSSNPSSRRTSLGRSLSETTGFYIPNDSNNTIGGAMNNISSRSGHIQNPNKGGLGTGSGNTNESVAVGGGEIDFIREFILPSVRSLNDSMNTLDKNFSDLNIIQENLIDFNESLGSLLYGIMFNSWCVAYPSIPRDVKRELGNVELLNSIKLEKQELQRQISNLQTPESSSIHGESQFIQPSLTVEQVKRHNNRLQEMRFNSNSNDREEYHNKEEDDEDDEVNSEASFVMNPALKTNNSNYSGIHGSSSNSIKNRQRNSKLRRKSILHTIRNSIASQNEIISGSIGNAATRIASMNTQDQNHNHLRQVRKPSRTSKTYPGAISNTTTSTTDTTEPRRPTDQRRNRASTTLPRPPFR